ncbi:hypothetical protein DSL64_26735 [Dyadobacter luteus]|uniref:Uncharacterized protein n=1 Tax=Dyadobacter luteus TaxID=2259619 RepID=A0A3D8Y3A6_9BACT|nr:hypothetical protein [Dyadobacter luteus]REA56517.1 hypothetical protein DSL64_26735 [Dyadobacter luteus]
MKNYQLIIFLFVFLCSDLYAQKYKNVVELNLERTSSATDFTHNIQIKRSVTKYKSRVVFRLSLPDGDRDSSLVLRILMPVVSGYDYDFGDKIFKLDDEGTKQIPVLYFSDLIKQETGYAFYVPLIQSLSSHSERRVIYLRYKNI